jgi:hypothetical protein
LCLCAARFRRDAGLNAAIRAGAMTTDEPRRRQADRRVLCGSFRTAAIHLAMCMTNHRGD